MSELDLTVVDELLSTTRSIRKKLDLERPVDPAVIDECIELSLQAPTGGNSQGWRWIVVTDPDLRAGLADIYARAARGLLAAARRRARGTAVTRRTPRSTTARPTSSTCCTGCRST